MGLLMSIVGMLVLIGIAVLFSDNRKAINMRTVGGAFAIQFFLGAFVLYVPWGQEALSKMTNGVQYVIDFGNEGIGFLFGNLVNFSVEGLGFIFAFNVLPTIIFFSALISVLYYLGVMQFIIKILGGGLQLALGTSRAESMSATANIFVGQTEAPLVVRPFVPRMTKSELFAVMCGGLASVAGGVMAGYAAMGVPLEYLIAASFMAAPGGLLFAKLLKPETGEPIEQLDEIEENEDDKPANVIDAAASGAASGLSLALNVGAMLLAFVGLIALLNGILGGVGGYFGFGDTELVNAYKAFVASGVDVKTIIHEIVAYDLDKVALGDEYKVVLNEGIKNFNIVAVDRDAIISVFKEIPNNDLAVTVLKASEAKLSLEMILGYLFSPLAFLIGVPWNEAILAGSFIGQKTILNEFVAYSNFAPYLKETTEIILSDKTKAIISFALCGFANLSSIAILLGGLGGLAPARRSEIAQMGMKAILAGTLSNLMAATIAGFFITLQAM